MYKSNANVSSNKATLRTHYKNLRQDFFKSAGRRVADPLTRNLKRLVEDYAKAQSELQVCLYQPMGSEAVCLFDDVCKFYFPVIASDGLAFYRPNHPKEFSVNAWGVLEPIPQQSTAFNLAQPIMVCCPAVAVDLQGQRLGQGKGCYDRFFSLHPEAIRVGVIYQVQVFKGSLPAESFDQALDWIVSEKMILRIGSTKRSS